MQLTMRMEISIMKWLKRLPATGHDLMTLPESAVVFKEKAEVLLNTTLSLPDLLKTFALDRKEIQIENFRDNIDYSW